MKKIILGFTMVASLFMACDNEQITETEETISASNLVTGNNSRIWTIENSYSSIVGNDIVGRIDPANLQRRDNSDIIFVDGLYYVWYSVIDRGVTSTVWYATSPDGYEWTEQGMAIDRGSNTSDFDSAFAYTPGIFRDVTNNKYYLYWTGQSFADGTQEERKSRPTRIGVAVADHPSGPWTKSPNNPILSPELGSTTAPDNFRIDDTSCVIRNGTIFLYYKGNRNGIPGRTQLCVATATNPAGPFTKYANNPVIAAGHEVLVWAHGKKGIGAHINDVGLNSSLFNANYYSADGFNFEKFAEFDNAVPHAPGAYKPESWNNTGGKMPLWGLSIAGPNANNMYLQRYDWDITGSYNSN